MRLLFQIAILAVTAAVTFPGSGTGGAKVQPLEDPNVWVIRVPIEATGHSSPSEHPATFTDEAECLEFLGGGQFAADLQEYKLYEHTQHGDRVKFGVPRCEQRGVDGTPA